MATRDSRRPLAMAVCAAALFAGAVAGVAQQTPAPSGQAGQTAARGGRGGGGRGGVAPALFTAVDTNKDGSATRAEVKSAFESWFATSDAGTTGAVTEEQLVSGVTAALPQPAPSAGRGGQQQPADQCGGRSPQPQVPCPSDVQAMMAALPDKAPATPKQPRKLLVLAATSGFVHSSIPLAARMVEEMGKKTGAWTTSISYDRAVVTPENLKQYDAIFLDSTTGTFLDDPNAATDPAAKAATDARRKALLDFIRGGKGIAAIHAASDSYHGNPNPPAEAVEPAPARGGAGRGGPGATLASLMLTQGDRNSDRKLSKDEISALADAWFDKLDAQRAGAVSQQDFAQRFAAIQPPPAVAAGGGGGGSPLWPEWNRIIGGYFKHHWNYPTKITVKIDDPRSPINAPFKGQPFDVTDEVYTYNQDSFSRTNVHVLTSIDYSKMTPEVRAQESNPRTDQDYALSWIRREGKGRLFYQALGHHESIYAIRPMLEHILAGTQYALGDLEADDSPGVKK